MLSNSNVDSENICEFCEKVKEAFKKFLHMNSDKQPKSLIRKEGLDNIHPDNES